jgi:hypothetical protein
MAGTKSLHTDEEWAELIEEQKNSGLSKHQWCITKGLNQRTFTDAITRQQIREAYPDYGNNYTKARSDADWQALINEEEQSSLGHEEWCIQNNINWRSMTAAKNRIKNKNKYSKARAKEKPKPELATGNGWAKAVIVDEAPPQKFELTEPGKEQIAKQETPPPQTIDSATIKSKINIDLAIKVVKFEMIIPAGFTSDALTDVLKAVVSV